MPSGVAPTDAPPLASGFTPTVTTPPSSTADPVASTPATSSNAAALKGSSSVAVSTVVAACVGAFVGLAILICLFIWWSRHPSTKSRNLPRSPVAENRNARGQEEQRRVHSEMWDKLEDESSWGGMPPATRQMSQQEIDEKNFSMFKKRSNSTRTTRTTRALEEHGFDMPLPEISKYHPELAKELALEQPERPYAQRQESGVSWDGETLGDDSFLSLRSVRIESGAMSPTMAMAKMTPPAMPSALHRWESAEVLTVDESFSESANPFSDGEDRRKSRSNPFFSAGEVHRGSSRRSRSNSRGQSHSRNPSRTSRSVVRARVVSEAGSQIDPFADLQDPPPQPSVPAASSHAHSASIGSVATEMVEPDRTMQSLIAALDLGTQPADRLRVVSMQPSTASRYSSFLEPEDDVGIARDYPPTPTSPTGH